MATARSLPIPSSGELVPTFDVEVTDLQGFILATTRTDRAGDGPGGADPVQIRNYADVSIPTPLSDTREGAVSFSAYEEVAGLLYFEGIPDDSSATYQIGALGRMLRIYVRQSTQPKFWGPIVIANWEAGSGRVLVTAHDQSVRLKKHFARWGDETVGEFGDPAKPLNPLDYRTIRRLVEHAENTPTQNNYPPLGIDIASGSNDGLDAPWVVRHDHTSGNFTLTFDGDTTGNIAYNASASTLESALEALSSIGVGDVVVTKPSAGLWEIVLTGALDGALDPLTGSVGSLAGGDYFTVARSLIEIARGDNIWERVVEVSESRYGPDFELEPRDDLGVCQTHDDTVTEWPFYCVLNTYEQQGTDRTGTLTFTYIEGAADNNLEDVEWEPSGDPVRNTVTSVGQGTETDPGERVFAHDLDSWTDIGIYVNWQNPAGGNTEFTREAMRDVANDEVAAYSRPPNFFTLRVRAERPAGFDPTHDIPRVYEDYDVGDTIDVDVQKGYMVFQGTGRITKITPRQLDQAGNLKCDIEVVPSVTSQASITSGDDD